MKVIKIDYKKFIEHYFMVIDREDQVPVPFKLNKVQEKYLEMLNKDHPNQEGVRDIILKARQQGFSSFILAMFTVDFIVRPYCVSICISHRRDSTELLFKKVRFYLESYLKKMAEEQGKIYTEDTLKSWLGSDNKGMISNSTNKSTFYIGTAGAKVGGRGGSARNVHFCVGGDTLLIHPDGSSSTIRDIKVGDTLVSNNGEKTKVINKWSTGNKSVREIKLWLSNKTTWVTPEHKIKTIDGWKKASELSTNDWVEWSTPTSDETIKNVTVDRLLHCVHLDNSKTVLSTDKKLGYFLGYYLAEGTITKNFNRLEFTCHKDEEFYKKFADLFPHTPTVKIKTDDYGTRKTITYNSKEIATFVEKLMGRTKDKKIPVEFLEHYPLLFLEGLYDGWKDGDGSKGKPHCCYISTIREKIARQMRQIAMMTKKKVISFNYYPNRKRYEVKTSPIYTLIECHKGNNLGRRSLKYKEKDGKFFIKVRSVVKSGIQDTYEIGVDNKDHSFLTDTGLQSNSEAGFYQDTEMLKASEMILATAQQVPQGRGMIFIESTANGEGNFYHAEWERAEDHQSIYTPRFFGWQEFYSEAWVEEKRKEFPSDKLWKQEYPANPQEAFITSGSPFFDIELLKKMADVKAIPVEFGRIMPDGQFL